MTGVMEAGDSRMEQSMFRRHLSPNGVGLGCLAAPRFRPSCSTPGQPEKYPPTFYYISLVAMTPLSSTLAWKIPWMEEPGGLQSMGSLRVRHD